MRVLYISTNFTALSHTFITREINQLRELGADVHLLSLRTPETSATTVPECDLKGCLFAYPAPFISVVKGLMTNLVSNPSRLGHALRIVMSSQDSSLSVKIKLLYQLAIAARFAPTLQKAGIEHIHAHFAGSPTIFALLLHCLTSIPFSFTDHGAGIFHERVALDIKFRLAAGISAISHFNIAYYKKFTNHLPPVRVVRCGLALDRFPFQPRTTCQDPIQILAVSRLVPKKGFSYLLEALAILSREGIRWRGQLVGEGPLLVGLKHQAMELGLRDLEFTGPLQQADIKSLLQQADIFVLPCVVAADGDMDGIPVTLMEAMACGCPVISTRVSGIPELVIDEQTGLLLEPENAADLATAIERLSRNPDLVKQVSRGGRDWIEKEFNIVTSAQRQLAFFQELKAQRENI